MSKKLGLPILRSVRCFLFSARQLSWREITAEADMDSPAARALPAVVAASTAAEASSGIIFGGQRFSAGPRYNGGHRDYSRERGC